MSTLQRAIEIATEAHQGQLDKAGRDYIGHPLRVMEMGKTENEKIVGVLHDVIEDSDWTFEKLAEEGFSDEVIAALKCVTKTSENENYDDFIDRVKKNPLAAAVKINDLTDNMDIRRLPYLSDKDVKRLKKYLKAYKRLTESLSILYMLPNRRIPMLMILGQRRQTQNWQGCGLKESLWLISLTTSDESTQQL